MKTRALALTLLVLSAACPARASFSGGEAVRCVVTVKKVLLKNRAGDWLTLSDAEYPIDLAGEQASFTVENKGRLPAGDYENFRIVLSETFKVAGVDGANRTKQGGAIRVGGTASGGEELASMDVLAFEQKAPTWSKEDPPGDITVTLDLDHQDRDDVIEIVSPRGFPKPLPLKENSSVTVRIGADVKNVVHYASANYFAGIPSERAMYFLPPDSLTEVSFKADGNSRLVTSEGLEWQF